MRFFKLALCTLSFLCISISLHAYQTLGGLDYRSHQSPVKNQGDRGTCTAFAVAAALEVLPGAPIDVSEKYIYGIRKMIEYDMGQGKITYGDFATNYAYGLERYGLIPEYMLPYNGSYTKWYQFDNELRKVILESDVGPVSLLVEYVPKARTFLATGKYRIYNETERRDVQMIKNLLMSGVKAIPVGYDVYAPQWLTNSGKPSSRLTINLAGRGIEGLSQTLTFMAARNLHGDELVPKILSGDLTMVRTNPDPNTYSGHAVTIVGYDSKGFILKNSWGTDWGDQGYFHISYDFHRLFVNEMVVFFGLYSK